MVQIIRIPKVSTHGRYFYVYLVQLIIPALFLTFLPLGRMLIGVALLLAFTLAYIGSYASSYRTKLVSIVFEVALMLAMASVLNIGYLWLIYYPAAALGVWGERRHMRIGLFVLVALGAAEVLWQYHGQTVQIRGAWPMFIAGVIGVYAVAFGTRWQSEMSKSRSELQKANAQIERLTKVAERERISQDLHDVIGHDLSMITLKSQLVMRLIDRDPERAKQEVSDIEQAARQALSGVREYISEIREPKLDEEWADAQKLLAAAGIECQAEIDCSAPTGSGHAMLAMCLREAATNIVRHSAANKTIILIRQHAGQLDLLVADNGKGLSTALSQGQHQTGYGGIGLKGIRARLSSVDGKLRLWSNGQPWAHEREWPTEIPWKTGTALLMTAPLKVDLGQSTGVSV